MGMDKDRDFKFGLSLLKVAEYDIASAEFLCNKGIYHNAVYFLQQSVEKQIKSFGLIHEVLSIEDLFKISHKSYITFKLIGEKRIKENLEFIKNEDLIYQEDVLEFNRNIKNSLSEIEKINLKDYEDISLEELDSILLDLEGDQKMDPQNMEELIEGMGGEMAGNLINIPEVNIYAQSNRESYQEYMKLAAKLEILTLLVNRTLLQLSLLLDPYVAKSRYPCKLLGDAPMLVFNERNPLIIRFAQLISYSRKSCLMRIWILKLLYPNYFQCEEE